jgi:hypothetical protein
MTATSAPRRPTNKLGFGTFSSAIRSEWVKFRTVRGWIIALVFGAAATFFLCYKTAAGPTTGDCSGSSAGAGCTTGPATVVPTGPDGEAVADTYEFVHRTLTGDGTVTTEITSLTGVTSTNPSSIEGLGATSQPGLAPWAKAGLLLTPRTTQGSAYAAVMATGNQGIHFQYNYTHDTPGVGGSVATSLPRWLRLVRSGDTITSYESADGQHWTEVGSSDLQGLPVEVQVGLFATSPLTFRGDTGYPTLATATFDHVTVDDGLASNPWLGQDIGTGSGSFYPTLASGSYHDSGTSVVVRGSGDIAPAVVEGVMGTHTASSSLPLGLIMGLLVVIVVASMFVTTEYGRGLIRTTFTAIPARGRVLAAKGVVVGAVAFVLSLGVMAVIVPLGQNLLRANGNYVFPATTLAQARIVIGASAIVGMAAITAIALAAILRRSAAAITAGTAVFLLPFILAETVGGGTSDWLLRLTPAAGLSMLQALPHYGQVSYPYTLSNGYFPLSPLAGFAVLCGYTVIALGAATVVLNRRDA